MPLLSLEEVAERMDTAAQAWVEQKPGVLSIVDDEDRFLGTIAWRTDLSPGFATADIGYGVHPDARGRGVAGAAVRLITRWLFSDEGPSMARVQLDHSTENLASCRVALGAGMAKEGVRLGYLPLRDPAAPGGVRRHDVCMHGVLKDPGRGSHTDR